MMAHTARSLDFRVWECGLRAEHVVILRSRQQAHICRGLASYFFSLIGKVRLVWLRPTVCYSCHSIFATESLDLSENREFVLVLPLLAVW